jgi:glutathione gamma-glutamylcysteinyltransferase
LNFDPKKVWKGAWRWVSEETLQCESASLCGHSLERIRSDGMHFFEFESLARCHGVQIVSTLADNLVHEIFCHEGKNKFRRLVQQSSQCNKAETFIVVNFSRKVLGQTGSGHFSPVGGYHPGKDLVLIMDVARFKYPPFWVPLDHLWDSMAVKDETTGESRGYFTISNNSSVVIEIERDKDERRRESATCCNHVSNRVGGI